MDSEIRHYLNWLKRRDDELAEELRKLLTDRQHDAAAAQVQMFKDVLAAQFRESSSYTNLVILGGYAGIFALWQLMSATLPNSWRLVVTILMTCSVMLFSAHELFKMMRHERLQAKLRRAIAQLTAQQRLAAWQTAEDAFQLGESRIWPWFLVPTAWSGLLAGVILLLSFVLRVARLL